MLLTSQSPVASRASATSPCRRSPFRRKAPIPPRATRCSCFVARARAVVPGFAPDAAALRDVSAIVDVLDGIPLAIELAARARK
jgi:predicted ATPase